MPVCFLMTGYIDERVTPAEHRRDGLEPEQVGIPPGQFQASLVNRIRFLMFMRLVTRSESHRARLRTTRFQLFC